MKIVISAGHSKYCRGAKGYIDEYDENCKVVTTVASMLNGIGVETIPYIDTISTTQDENLDRICEFHNSKQRDYDVSIHFNCSNGEGHGTEVFYQSQKALAAKISSAISAAVGITDRGAKTGSLYFLSHTEAPAVLVECCFVDNKSDTNAYAERYTEMCDAIASAISGQQIQSEPTPPPSRPERPPVTQPQPPASSAAERPTIAQGDKGPAVVELQKALGVLEADGDFGGVTDTWVRAFQGACGLSKDGVVGPMTWEEIDDLSDRLKFGTPPLPKELADQIYTMAQQSEIADYSWPDRGVPPPGYIAGMALSFAYAVTRYNEGDEDTTVMAKAEGNPDYDALAWYKNEFAGVGMSNKTAGLHTLRHLFVMMIGLGTRESSGKYCEGRDLSADNVQAETAEASLFQTSWNIKAGNSTIDPLLDDFWQNPNGFLPVFKEGISPTKSNLDCYGSGDGARYQFLARFCPLFTVMITGVGMRTLRQHWGPLNRKEVTLKREADDLLKQVQDLMEAVA